MLRKIYITLITLLVTGVAAMAQSGAIKGTVVDAKNNEPIPFVGIVVFANGSQVASAQTDFDGNFTIKPINPGKYTIQAVILGYQKVEQSGILVASDKFAFTSIKMSSTTTELKEFVKQEYKVPLLEKDQTSTGGTLTRDEIANAPTRNINSVVSTAAGVSQTDDNKALNVKGGRSDATTYYVDGVKVRGGSPRLPNAGIEQITVITGGVPAQYGDATSGVISITTRGPSRDFTGGAEVQSSQLTDSYGYNLVSLNASGPIYSKKQGNVKTPVVGFFVAGEFEGNKDANPSSIGSYKLKDDVYERLRKTPLALGLYGSEPGYRTNGEYVTFNDLEKTKARQNDASKTVSLSGRLDYKPSTNSTLAFGGTYLYDNPNILAAENNLYNFANNRESITNSYRVYGRFTQKFGSQETNGKSASIIKNAYYTIQADYTDTRNVQQDKRFKDDFFKYGYVGKFTDTGKRDTISTLDSVKVGAYTQTQIKFTPGNYSDDREVYTSNAFNFAQENGLAITNINSPRIASLGGLLNGQAPQSIYGIFANSGTISNRYQKTDNQQFRITASGSADIKNHAISFGLEYEQRTERAYIINPVGLWGIARQEEGKRDPTGAYIYKKDTIINGATKQIYEQEYNGSSTFDTNLRNKLGLSTSVGGPINIDKYDPSTFNIGMFDAKELLDQGVISYNGYDYAGNEISSKQSFEDFFKNDKKRVVGAFQPNYIAGYIQDKFAFRDLIFSIGLRVDRYDANQKVLKDKYLLYEAKTAGDIASPRPANIGDDYTVYLNGPTFIQYSPTDNNIIGYRKGDIFYDSRGTKLDGSDVLKQGSTRLYPYLVDPTDIDLNKIKNSTYNTKVFKDYEAQVNVMPRISFSFPISEEALFFAHYDVLTQRPGSGESRLNPLSYLYLVDNGGTTISNPDLKPSRTTDYELGFKQKLTNTSAITLSGFYRELRDQIQLITLKSAYPIDYQTYGNKDFGTVKGLTAAFDLRRTNNVRLTLSYTLQFADGTGSSSTSGVNLNASEPDLRTPIPLDFDQRHVIVANVDYRYESGADYNGPILFGKRIFENTGLNLIIRAGSGTPYSRKGAPVDITDTRGAFLVGTINGSNLPWNYKTDLKLDKDINLHFGKAGEDKRPVSLNVYILVQNLFDTQNILGVYPYTGSPTDDGFLASALGQQKISNQTSAQAYQDLYTVNLANPANFSLPRRIRLGVAINF